MGALRHVVARRVHKERHQVSHRKKLGILEKKKDYRERAKDYKSKQAELAKLREKAAFRNPDEYNSKMKDARLLSDGNVILDTEMKKELSKEQAALADSQDLRYVRSRRQIDQKAIEKLNQAVIPAPEGKRVVFPDSDDEGGAKEELKEFLLSGSSTAARLREKRLARLESLKKVEHHLALKEELRKGKGNKHKVMQNPDGTKIIRWKQKRQK